MVSLLLALALVSGAAAVGAQEQAARSGDPVAQLTGEIWQKTSPDNKASFIFGMETAIAVEHAVNGKLTESAAARGKLPSPTPFSFEKAWAKAFKDLLVGRLFRKWMPGMPANPGELSRPVMNVLWYHVIQPRLASQK